MKAKSIIFLASCLIINYISIAQNMNEIVGDTSKNEIIIGYSRLSTNALLIIQTFALPFPFGASMGNYDPSFLGVFTIGYQKQKTKRVKLSATLAYERIKLENLSSHYSEIGNYYKILAGLKLKYNMINSKVDFYGRLDMGALIYDENFKGGDQPGSTILVNPSKFALQISPLCFRFGKQIGGFVELGFGSLGVINFGFCYKY